MVHPTSRLLAAGILCAFAADSTLAQCGPGSCGPSTRAFAIRTGGEGSRPFDLTQPPVVDRPDGVPLGVHEQDLTIEQQQLLSQHNKRRLAVEKQLRVLSRKHFDNIQNPKIRAEGIAKLREFTDPAVYPLLVTLFAKEGQDVRAAVLDLLREQHSYEADTTLAWCAMFDKDEWFRAQAATRLNSRVSSEGGKVPAAVSSVIASAFLTPDPQAHQRAGILSQNLGLIEALPAMILAQGGSSASRSSSSGGNLATILIGRQVTFISDLTPVVGQNAVGFDPQVSVLTEGVYMNVNDAVVTWRNVALNSQLQGWASALTGRSVAHLGFDQSAWRRWYADEFRPAMTRKSQLITAMVGEAQTDLLPSRTPVGSQ